MSHEDVTLVPIAKKTTAELIKDLASHEGNVALVAVFERMTQLEIINSTIKDVIVAARELERNYTIPGPKRFKRVVRLRKALDELESRAKKGRL